MRLEGELREYGEYFSSLAMCLKTDPQRIVFANAPFKFRFNPSMHREVQFHRDWDKLPKWEAIAQLIQELHQQKKRLLDAEMQLLQA